MADGKTKKGILAGNLKAAIAGAAALLFQGTATAGTIVQPIANRARERYSASATNVPSNTPEQLLMQPAGDMPTALAHASHSSHGSHRSHSSHRSHYSSSGVAPTIAPVK